MNHIQQSIFDQAIRTADMLVKMLGNECEVAIHDFTDLEQSLIHLAGTITERKVGAPITDLVLQELKKPDKEIKDIANYKTVSAKGYVLKSSTVFLRDLEGKVIGAMCINLNVSHLITINNQLQQLVQFEHEETDKESFYSSVQEVIANLVGQVLKGFNKAPSLLEMDEKIECVRLLEQKGTFLIKGSTEYVAGALGVSKFTIYSYLQKIRADTMLHLN
ncbi:MULTISPECIES: helix-turn-helix transcriptional regulator [Paenibacillus]|uniref:PAS domain-containing protein n=1 Tax=Paenibacillus radicis (ex Xue et al. 2023) TaxID=2972489 RepID=A0ABT1YSG0_9BACL|nr:PAS domain-containing protein [Paenibacillus radicis (ex Xue et al. 2023)]MCR8635233.1 PAS domain-containing protein [Paenibacillus radicis (ex Xue et al. 2023)]